MSPSSSIAAAFAIAALGPAALALTPRAGAPVAVVALPWAADGALDLAAAAGGDLEGTLFGGAVAIARSDAPAFTTRLRRAGALVLDATLFGGCTPVPPPAPFSVRSA